MAKKNRKHGTVFHSEIWGDRLSKYRSLEAADVAQTDWTELSPEGPYFFFVPKNFDARSEYESGWPLREIFPVAQNGLKSDRDTLFIDFDAEHLLRRMATFYSPAGLEPEFRREYNVENSSSYDLLTRRVKTSFDAGNVHQCLYRPYDLRWIYYAPGLTSRPAWEVMQHMLQGTNLGVLVTRQTSDQWDVLATRWLSGHKSMAAYDINTLVPLYRYEGASNQSLFDQGNPPVRRHANLAPEFIADFSQRLRLQFVPEGIGDRVTTFGPEDVFHYMYAVFHSRTYRTRYAEFLKIDFPRLPLTSDLDLFAKLCAIGTELTDVHLMDKPTAYVTRYPLTGDNAVEQVVYTAPSRDGIQGRVWINNTQYFEGIVPEVWEFRVGGYQVAEKWLKDRKGRRLIYDDLTQYQRLVSAVQSTMALMDSVDDVINKHAGWPISGSVRG